MKIVHKTKKRFQQANRESSQQRIRNLEEQISIQKQTIDNLNEFIELLRYDLQKAKMTFSEKRLRKL